jgi:hypothetical protein
MKIRGQCPCGAVTYTVEGDPVAQAYCHCRSCQTAHAGPFMAVALFPAGAVTLLGETTRMSVTKRQHAATRISCARCATRVAVIPSGEEGDQLRGIFPALCESRDWFRPSMHLYWEQRSIEVRDDLPKYLDEPTEFGGSGRTA